MLAGLGAGRPHDGPLDWLVPAALRAAECTIILLAGINDAVPWPLTFALLGVVALFHYDLAARVDKSVSPLGARWLALGWDVRLSIIGLAAFLDISSQTVVVLTLYLAVVFVGGSLYGLIRSRRRPDHPADAAVAPVVVPQPARGLDRRASLRSATAVTGEG